jgi:transcriptional regulator with XRE-family HTH domain
MKEKSFAALFEAAERHDEYWTERAIIEFTEDLSLWMESKKISQADLAASMGVSQPYISKVLKGNVNFTLATMTKLARALGAEVHIRLAPIGSPEGAAGDLERGQPEGGRPGAISR